MTMTKQSKVSTLTFFPPIGVTERAKKNVDKIFSQFLLTAGKFLPKLFFFRKKVPKFFFLTSKKIIFEAAIYHFTEKNKKIWYF